MITFSIIVPIYNSDKYLTRCLNSIREQQYKRIEVIMVDDGSTDNSPVIAQQFQKKDSRFHYYRQNNSGPASARNLGIRVCTGEYICFIDSDDVLLPHYFNKISQRLKTDALDVLEINAFYQNENSNNLRKYLHFSYRNKVSDGVEYLSHFLDENHYFNVVPWTKVLNRKFVLTHHLFFENVYAEDELWARTVFIYASRVMFLDECLYLQYRRLSSQSKKKCDESNVKDQKATYYKLAQLYKTHVKRKNQLNILLDELSHNFVAVSVLNPNVRISSKDKIFAISNAKSFVNIANALIFCISPKLRRSIKGVVVK